MNTKKTKSNTKYNKTHHISSDLSNLTSSNEFEPYNNSDSSHEESDFNEFAHQVINLSTHELYKLYPTYTLRYIFQIEKLKSTLLKHEQELNSESIDTDELMLINQ